MVETVSASVVTFAREYVRRVEKKRTKLLLHEQIHNVLDEISMKSRYDCFQRSPAI